MATAPNFTSTPRVGMVQISTANTNRDGTGTIGTVMAGGADGSRIERVRIQAAGTTTAGVVRLYLDDNSNVRLIREILVSAITPSTTLAAWSADVDFSTPENLMVLPSSSWELQASTNNAETFNVIAYGGDF